MQLQLFVFSCALGLVSASAASSEGSVLQKNIGARIFGQSAAGAHEGSRNQGKHGIHLRSGVHRQQAGKQIQITKNKRKRSNGFDPATWVSNAVGAGNPDDGQALTESSGHDGGNTESSNEVPARKGVSIIRPGSPAPGGSISTNPDNTVDSAGGTGGNSRTGSGNTGIGNVGDRSPGGDVSSGTDTGNRDTGSSNNAPANRVVNNAPVDQASPASSPDSAAPSGNGGSSNNNVTPNGCAHEDGAATGNPGWTCNSAGSNTGLSPRHLESLRFFTRQSTPSYVSTMNSWRSKFCLPPLTFNAALEQSAQRQSQDAASKGSMVETPGQGEGTVMARGGGPSFESATLFWIYEVHTTNVDSCTCANAYKNFQWTERGHYDFLVGKEAGKFGSIGCVYNEALGGLWTCSLGMS